MPLVVDASVAVKWVLPEPGSDRARRLLRRGGLAAPDLLRLEVANALWKQARRGSISAQAARRGWMLFTGIPVAFQQPSALATAAFDMALQHGITVYDATYVALASALNCPVVTADRRLLEMARTQGLAGRVLSLEDVP